MRVFISTDIEGTAGVVDTEQVRGPGAEYEIGRQLLTDEVNATADEGRPFLPDIEAVVVKRSIGDRDR